MIYVFPAGYSDGFWLSAAVLRFLLINLASSLIALEADDPEVCKQLNKFITCYEQIEFTNTHSDGLYTSITYKAFGDIVTLVLHPAEENAINFPYTPYYHSQVHTSSVKVTVIDKLYSKSYNYEATNFYYGKVKQWPDAYAYGIYRKQVFRGTVHTSKEIYYIEPKEKYFRNNSSKSIDSSMVIYKASEIKFWEHKKARWGVDKTNLTYLSDSGVKPLILNSYMRGDSSHQKKRSKRSLHTAKLCEIHAASDHTFFQTSGGNDEITTIEEILTHMAESDIIFRLTDFDGDFLPDNVGFIVSKVDIYKSVNSKNYHMKAITNDASDDLINYSKYDHGKACLAILFTHREYSDGVIGLAWMASSSFYGRAGGICQKRTKIKGIPYSYNSLIVTSLNFGDMIPQKVTTSTVAHEIGHSFGSKHDEVQNENCNPEDPYGHYLMHPHDSDTTNPNNFKFSPCSRLQIGPVIAKKGVRCFQTVQEKRCGNKRLDRGEECDCGYEAECTLRDKCCNPAYLTEENKGGCTLKKGKICSPFASKCCNATCQILSKHVICRQATECIKEASCDGVSAECPDVINKPNDTICDEGRRFCFNGECTESICELYNLRQCQCTSNEDDMCQLCCQQKNSPCRPAVSFNIKFNEGKIYLNRGHSCNNHTGYCDARRKCFITNKVSVFKRLYDFIKDDLPELAHKAWSDYWFVIIFGVMLLTMVITTFIVRHRKISSSKLHDETREKSEKIEKEAKQEKSLLNKQLTGLQNHFDEHITELSMHQKIDVITAINRLSYFVPSATREQIFEVLNNCDNEDEAVMQLLEMNDQAVKQILENNNQVVKRLLERKDQAVKYLREKKNHAEDFVT